MFFGLAFDMISFNENLNKERIFRNLKPELVEKKEPPIIINIKNIKDKYFGVSSKDIPIFETLLAIANKITLKFSFLSKSKKNKNIIVDK